ncbi:MAG: hypothetical protein AAF662_09675 [Pseudomonadota bacterium]
MMRSSGGPPLVFFSQLVMGILLLLSVVAFGAGSATAQNSPMDHSRMNHSAMDPKAEDVDPNSTPPMDNMSDHGGTAHGDHNPRFGGLVLMYGLLHFEIVGKPEGGVELHLSDAMRAPMPAVSVSDVTVEIERPGGEYELVTMTVSEAGDFWSGISAPLVDHENTTVHVAFVAFGNPYVYAVPLSAMRPEELIGETSTDTAMLTPGPRLSYAH